MPSPPLSESPKLKANFVSSLFFWWLNDLFRQGYSKNLELSDLHKTLPEDEAKVLGDTFSDEWESQLKKRKPKQRKLLRVIWKIFSQPFVGIGIIKFFEECLSKIATPICLGYLIKYFTGDVTRTVGLLAAAGIILGQIFNIATMHSYFLKIEHLGMKIRVSCSAALYKKALKLKLSTLGGSTTGKIMNLMANDLNRFDNLQHIHYLWIGVFQTGISTFILWKFFGPACLCGLAVLILFVPFQGFLGNIFTKLRINAASKTDRRIRIMNEILSGIRAIKMHCWEDTFSKLLDSVRREEMHALTKITALRSINWSMYYTSSKITIFLTLIVYVISGHFLTAEIVFVAVSLYNNIKITMTLHFPLGIAQLADVFVAVKRVEEFLLFEERLEITTDNQNNNKVEFSRRNDGVQQLEDPRIVLMDASAKWHHESEDNALSGTNLSVTSNQLVAIIGSVGCGKSSLLQVLLQELPLSEGKLEIHGTLSYSSQEPWIYGSGRSIRDNITFGHDFNKEWYEKVTEACALQRDFYLLAPHGDLTLIGDRGVNLSGGQKARISLARSVYADADIFLLDDPLSAVDAEVARHIFEKCLKGLLKNKIVILVTHQIQFLNSVDKIVMMDKGKFVMQGTPEELTNRCEEFQSYSVSVHSQQPDTSPPIKQGLQSISGNKGDGSFAISNPCFEGDGDDFKEDMGGHRKEFGLINSTTPTAGLGTSRMKKPPSSINDISLRKFSVGLNSNGSSNLNLSQTDANEIRSEFESQDQLNDEERSADGSVSFSAYLKFFQAGSNFFSILLLIVFNILTQVLHTGSDYWLQVWSNYQENMAYHNGSNHNSGFLTLTQKKYSQSSIITSSVEFNNNSFSNSTEDSENREAEESPIPGVDFSLHNQILIYSSIIVFLFVFSMVRTTTFFHITINASIYLHKKMLNGVLRARMSFFDLNPIGRILNRFTKDTDQMDDALPQTFFESMEIFLSVIGTVVLVCIVSPYVLIPTVFLAIAFYFVRRIYIRSARSIKRLEAVARSPVFSHVSTTLEGLATIRAFRAEDAFRDQFYEHQDTHSSTWFLTVAMTRWIGMWLDWISVIFVTAVVLTLIFVGKTSGGEAGMAISAAMFLTGVFQWGVRQSASVESQMVSIERILDYTKLESEANLYSEPRKRPPDNWPFQGKIDVYNMNLQYRNPPPTLKNISLSIQSKEKIGIIGRTGAGKSSIIAALFRLAEPSGRIEIDGVNILEIGLHDLRSKVSIIPQDPFLFQGTLRKNLSMTGSHGDAELWAALRDVGLEGTIKTSPMGLDVEINEGGTNYSVGQRQLLCLARAIIRKNKILLLDEATASVDLETDILVQNAIRERFKDCTVLTIAHRLFTVMDNDRILVMDEGFAKEFDAPHLLLQNQVGLLSSMVDQTGEESANRLRQIALQAYRRKHWEDSMNGESFA